MPDREGRGSWRHPNQDGNTYGNRMASALIVLLACLAVSPVAQENAPGPLQRSDLERRKLELEIATLERERGEVPPWLAAALGVLTGVVGAAASFWVARRSRLGALDQAVHEKRLKCYPALVQLTAPLALYFPDFPAGEGRLTRDKCHEIGRGMSKWYFEGGGLLMSVEARAYFRLARALTRASVAEGLSVPTFPRDADAVSREKIRKYRTALSESKLNIFDVEAWHFGPALPDQGPAAKLDHMRFKDYVLLQRLGSDIRTTLAEDLRGRRRPS
jgi:hypothetical protein